MLLGFDIAFVFIICLLLSLLRVGSDDDVGDGQNQVIKEGINNEGMPPSLIILILCLQNCIVFYGYYMHAILILVASVSIDTLP